MNDDPLPTGERLSPEEVGRRFLPMRTTPYGNPVLAFRMLIPAGWQIDRIEAATGEISDQRLKPLALFTDGSAYLQIQAVRLSREIAAVNWIRYYTQISEYEIFTIKELNANFADSRVQFAISGTDFIGRLAVRIHADILFMVFAFAPESAYPNWADAFGLCVASFQPIAPASRKTIEDWLEYRLASLRFHHPASWQSRLVPNPPAGKAAVDLVSGTPEEGVTGMIRVKIVDKDLVTRAEMQIEDVIDEFSKTGLEIGSLRVNTGVDLAPDSRFEDGFVQIFEARTPAGLPQEFWVTVVEDEDVYVVLAMITPERSHEFRFWAINRRTYDIIGGTLT